MTRVLISFLLRIMYVQSDQKVFRKNLFINVRIIVTLDKVEILEVNKFLKGDMYSSESSVHAVYGFSKGRRIPENGFVYPFFSL